MSEMTLFSALILALFLLSLRATPISGASEIGVCYGQLGNNLPSPQDVINLYKSKNIQKMRLFSPDPSVLNALRGSNIELIVGVPNEEIGQLGSDPSAAANWVRTNIQAYSPDVSFKYIAVGNEVTAADPAANSIAAAMENIHNAILAAGLGGRIKVSTATFTALLQVSYPPSQGVFRDDVKPFIKPVIDFLSRTNSPLLVNVYPYFAYISDSKIPVDYVLFRSPEVVVQDGPFGYRNIFDAMVDAVYSALEEQGGGNVVIVVSESGWPSDGNPPAASLQNAGTYYGNLINHVKSGNGTPKRNTTALETYLFAMFDENEKYGAETEKHFGLFYPTKQQLKYSISFSSEYAQIS